MKTMNRRKERRKADALKKTKPLGKLGVPIFTVVVGVVLDTPDGPQTKYYWWAGEEENPSPEQIMQALHGPFDSDTEAEEAARIAIVGPDCKVIPGGKWDPAWSKPQ